MVASCVGLGQFSSVKFDVAHTIPREGGAFDSMNLAQLHQSVIACEKCARLRHYCLDVARQKRRAFLEWDYWGRPVPGFGDARARIWILGLAPAAHGANRTGRVFTGDRSGDFLFAALHRVGLASQPTSVSRDDGLRLKDVYISATARCAPPANKPQPDEISNCAPFLDDEWRLLKRKRVILALGKIGWDAASRLAARNGLHRMERVAFGHGAVLPMSDSMWLVGSYHVSQQNTFTGRLTEGMFDQVLRCCIALADGKAPFPAPGDGSP
jgi:uracil-DNA glycosylase family 4